MQSILKSCQVSIHEVKLTSIKNKNQLGFTFCQYTVLLIQYLIISG